MIKGITIDFVSSGTNAELHYIIPDGIADNKFSLERKSGDIVTNEVLDREEQEQYVITGKILQRD